MMTIEKIEKSLNQVKDDINSLISSVDNKYRDEKALIEYLDLLKDFTKGSLIYSVNKTKKELNSINNRIKTIESKAVELKANKAESKDLDENENAILNMMKLSLTNSNNFSFDGGHLMKYAEYGMSVRISYELKQGLHSLRSRMRDNDKTLVDNVKEVFKIDVTYNREYKDITFKLS